jgi:hypothetical protein
VETIAEWKDFLWLDVPEQMKRCRR